MNVRNIYNRLIYGTQPQEVNESRAERGNVPEERDPTVYRLSDLMQLDTTILYHAHHQLVDLLSKIKEVIAPNSDVSKMNHSPNEIAQIESSSTNHVTIAISPRGTRLFDETRPTIQEPVQVSNPTFRPN